MSIHSHLPFDQSTSHARIPAGGINLIASIDSVSEAQFTASFFGSTKALHGEVATTSPATTTHNHSNQQYSITAITPSAGAIAERYAYSAYGEPTICYASGSPLATQVSSLGNRYMYTGREWDSTAGLYHFRARWMSPRTGRFLTRDPIGYIHGSNLLSFLNNNSVNGLDPTGFYKIYDAGMAYCTEYCKEIGQGPRPCVSQCFTDPKNDQVIFDRWVAMESERDAWWADDLPKCPDKICIKKGKVDPKVKPKGFDVPGPIGIFEDNFHPGGHFSMRSKPVNGHSNQCVYDKNGVLIRTAPGHGTVDWQVPTGPTGGHMDHDVDPVMEAAQLDGCWVNGVPKGHIKPDCVGPNMKKYFGVRPLWAEEYVFTESWLTV